MAFQMQQHPTDGRKTSLQLSSRFAGPTIQDIERSLPAAHRHRLPPHLASLTISPDPFTLPPGWMRFLDLNTGRVSYYKRDISYAAAAAAAEAMGRNGRNIPQQDLKLNLTTLPPLITLHLPDSPTELMSATTVSPTSPLASCVSSEAAEEADDKVVSRSSSPPEVTSMILKGCPCCLMYVMVREEQKPKCPKCKNPYLLDFLNESSRNNNIDSNKRVRKE